MEVKFTSQDLEDPQGCLFKLSALLADHGIRTLQKHVGRTLKNCDGITGKVVAISTKTVTVETAPGEKRRECPITPKLLRALNKAQTRRVSPRAPHAPTTTR